MKFRWFARWYRWVEYAAFGRALERRRFAFLHRLARAERILVLGEGDGRTVEQILARVPSACIDVVELSPQMIALAEGRTGASGRLAFHCQDARAAVWPEHYYDAIVTNFFLDCFTETDARRIVRRLSEALSRDGIWLLGEFAIPPAGWPRTHARLWIWTMYRFFRIVTGLRTSALPPVEDLMREAGMCRIAQEKERADLLISEVWVHVAHGNPKP